MQGLQQTPNLVWKPQLPVPSEILLFTPLLGACWALLQGHLALEGLLGLQG